MSNALSSKALTPFGCSVDVDLSTPLSEEEQQELRDLFARHLLLRFRGQRLTASDQVRVMGYLGSVLRLPSGLDYEYVSNTRSDGKLGSDEISWHSDMQFSPMPFEALSLHALSVIDKMTSTRFASGARAYERLSSDQREFVGGLHALNVFASDFPGRNRSVALSAEAPRSVHPVVQQHPVTGVPFLFVSWQQTDSIVGLEAGESDQLLEQLFAVLYDEENVLEHHWSVGDLVIWDNQSLQHARGDISREGERTLQKVTLGQKNLLEMYPEFAGKTTDELRLSTASG